MHDTWCTRHTGGMHPQCNRMKGHTQGRTHPQCYQLNWHTGGDAPTMYPNEQTHKFFWQTNETDWLTHKAIYWGSMLPKKSKTWAFGWTSLWTWAPLSGENKILFKMISVFWNMKICEDIFLYLFWLPFVPSLILIKNDLNFQILLEFLTIFWRLKGGGSTYLYFYCFILCFRAYRSFDWKTGWPLEQALTPFPP